MLFLRKTAINGRIPTQAVARNQLKLASVNHSKIRNENILRMALVNASLNMN